MRRQLTTLAAIAALTALPATAHATDHPLRGEWDVLVANSPDTSSGRFHDGVDLYTSQGLSRPSGRFHDGVDLYTAPGFFNGHIEPIPVYLDE
jgi:hypothetical protein